MNNAITLVLDGRLNASLDWKSSRAEALQAVEKGFKIFWDINLGLFDQLKHPLTSNSQYLALVLSLEHFRDTLFKDFREHTVGLNLYRGPLDFSTQLDWNGENLTHLQGWLHDNSIPCGPLLNISAVDKNLVAFFSRDTGVEYLRLLANVLPDALNLYVTLEVSDQDDRLRQAFLSHRECYGRIVPQLMRSTLLTAPEATLAILLPSYKINRFDDANELRDALDYLSHQNIPYRLIPEELLISEWEGLDSIFVAPKSLSPTGKRKLQGFCAAGGCVVSLGEPIGVACEISWQEFRK